MGGNSKTLKFFIVLLIIGFLFGVGWLLGKNQISFFRNLPFTGSQELITDNIDRITGYYEPTIEELSGIYNTFTESILSRDVSDFIKTSSYELKTDITNNFPLPTEGYERVIIIDRERLFEDNLFEKYAPALFKFSLPQEIKYFRPQRIASLLSEDKQLTIKRIYYTCDYYYLERPDVNTYPEDGFVDFVYENGSWLVLSQSWKVQINENTSITSKYYDATSNAININTKKIPAENKQLEISRGSSIIFENITGMLLSTESTSGLSQWQTPLLYNSNFNISFSDAGEYSYILVNKSGIIEFEAKIEIL